MLPFPLQVSQGMWGIDLSVAILLSFGLGQAVGLKHAPNQGGKNPASKNLSFSVNLRRQNLPLLTDPGPAKQVISLIRSTFADDTFLTSPSRPAAKEPGEYEPFFFFFIGPPSKTKPLSIDPGQQQLKNQASNPFLSGCALRNYSSLAVRPCPSIHLLTRLT